MKLRTKMAIAMALAGLVAGGALANYCVTYVRDSMVECVRDGSSISDCGHGADDHIGYWDILAGSALFAWFMFIMGYQVGSDEANEKHREELLSKQEG